MTSDLTIRPPTAEHGWWDQHLDLSRRAFGPADESRVQANLEPTVAGGRCLGAFHRYRQLHLVPGWIPRIPLAAWSQSDFRRPGGRGLGGDDPVAVRPGGIQLLGRRDGARAGQPGRSPWWLLREQDANIAERESWMLRLLDAPAAIAARGFPATDIAVPLHVTDDLLPANSGRWDLTVRAGTGALSTNRTDHGAVSSPTSAGPAPLALGVRGLAELCAGTPVATLRRAGGILPSR